MLVSLIELKLNLREGSTYHEAVGQVLDRVQVLARNQPSRTFVLAAVADARRIEILHFTRMEDPVLTARSGLLPLTEAEGFKLLLHLFLTSEQQLGFIPPILPKSFTVGEVTVEFRQALSMTRHEVKACVYSGTLSDKTGADRCVAIRAGSGHRLDVEAHILGILAKRGIPHIPELLLVHRTLTVASLVTAPLGELISLANDAQLLLQVIFDVAFVIGCAWRHAEVLHADVSPGNIIHYEGRGRLIDWDHAIHGPGPHRGRIGTAPYAALQVLESPPANHTVSADLESLFYTLLDIATGSDLPWRGENSLQRKFYYMVANFGKVLELFEGQDDETATTGEVASPSTVTKELASRLHELFFPYGTYKKTVSPEEVQGAVVAVAEHFRLELAGPQPGPGQAL